MRSLIGKRISELRKTKEVSQEELAEGIGISRQRLDRMEKGEIDISYEVIRDIAMYLQINPKRITDACKTLATSGSEEIDEMLSFFYANKSLYNRTKT